MTSSPVFERALASAEVVLDDALTAPRVVPIDIEAACLMYGLGEPIVEHAPRTLHGGLRVISGKKYPIVYRSRVAGRGLSPRERFTVAHEIAHAIIEDALGIRPARQAEYWALEKVCDRFAGRLLVPDAIARDYFQDTSDSRLLLRQIRELSTLTRASLPCCARRAADVSPGASMFGVAESDEGTARATRFDVQWAVEAPTLYGIRRPARVKQSHGIFPLIEDARPFVGETWSRDVVGGTGAAMRVAPAAVLIVVRHANGFPVEQVDAAPAALRS